MFRQDADGNATARRQYAFDLGDAAIERRPKVNGVAAQTLWERSGDKGQGVDRAFDNCRSSCGDELGVSRIRDSHHIAGSGRVPRQRRPGSAEAATLRRRRNRSRDPVMRLDIQHFTA